MFQEIPAYSQRKILKALPPHKANCHYCGRMTYAEDVGAAVAAGRECARRTRDHVKPAGLGGTSVVICCDGCNNIKGNTPAEVFRVFLREHLMSFRYMNTETRPRLAKNYHEFVFSLTLAGLLAAKALAIVAKRKHSDRSISASAPPRGPNGRFTKRDLRRTA